MLAHAGSADETISVVMLFAGLWLGWAGWSRLRQRGFPRLPVPGAVALVAAGMMLMIGAAFLPRALFPTNPGQATPIAAGRRPSSTATLAFARPTHGERVVNDELDVVLELEGGTVVDAATTDLTPDTGHVHLQLDGSLISMTYGLVQAVDLRRVPPGEHTLEAEYVAADHAPFAPQVTTTVRFETGADP